MTSANVRSTSSSFASPQGAWHALRPAPLHKPVHTAIARTLFHRVVPSLAVRVELPDGRVIGAGGPDAPLMRVRSDDFFRRLGSDGLIGFGEAFMAGDWDAEEPAAVLTPFAARMDRLVPAWMQRLRHYYVRHQPRGERNTRTGARANIRRHYDLSNELFALFLDETMTYSSRALRCTGRVIGRRAAAQGRHPARRHRRGPRQPGARDRYGLGDAGGARRAARRDRHDAHAVGGTGPRRARARGDAPASTVASTCNCATTATSKVGTTPS